MNNYDIIIIGGGISGLHTAYKLSNLNYKILLLDNRNYLGGRIFTYYEKNFNYELGAGRFNKNHKNLLKLLKKFNLTKIKISDNIDFRYKYKVFNNNIFYTYIKKILIKLNKINSNTLKNYTFKEICYKYFDKKKINTIIKYFGYKSEFEILNAYDAIKSFTTNFIGNNKFYVVKEGFTELCNRISKECINNNVTIKLNSLVTDIKYINNIFTITTTTANETSSINDNYNCNKII
jgi:protoporphyrinogen oxidase